MRHVFLTGGTGVIGSAMIPRLLADPSTRLTALLRANSDEELERRSRQLLKFCGIGDSSRSDRIHFIAGDVCQNQLGVSSQQYQELSETITGIVHSAGNVKLNQPLDIARHNICKPTMAIINLACQAKRLQKVDVVSTIGVAGRLPGTIPEIRLTEQRTYHNNYERAKAEAEELLWNGIDQGIPITIHRPSMVVGDSRNGAIPHYQVFYYLCDFLSGRKTRGIVPAFGNAGLDIVPSDFVAGVISHATNDPATIGNVLHLCAGDLPELRLSVLSQTIREVYESLGKECPPRRELPLSLFHRAAQLFSLLGPKELRKSARILPFFLTYLRQKQVFSIQETSRYMETTSIQLPSIQTYLPRVLEPYIRNRTATMPRQHEPVTCHVLT